MSEIKTIKGKVEFKQIPNFSKYSINTNGDIWSSISNKIMKVGFDSQGYVRLSILNDNGDRKTVKRCRLVATTHIPNPENKREVNHKNGFKWDDGIGNLEWMTPSENIKHAFDNGLKVIPDHQRTRFIAMAKSMIGQNNPKSVKTANIKTGISYDTITEAAHSIGISQGHLSAMLSGTKENTTDIIKL